MDFTLELPISPSTGLIFDPAKPFAGLVNFMKMFSGDVPMDNVANVTCLDSPTVLLKAFQGPPLLPIPSLPSRMRCDG